MSTPHPQHFIVSRHRWVQVHGSTNNSLTGRTHGNRFLHVDRVLGWGQMDWWHNVRAQERCHLWNMLNTIKWVWNELILLNWRGGKAKCWDWQCNFLILNYVNSDKDLQFHRADPRYGSSENWNVLCSCIHVCALMQCLKISPDQTTFFWKHVPSDIYVLCLKSDILMSQQGTS